MRNVHGRLGRIATLSLSLVLVGGAFAQGRGAAFDQRRAEVVASAAGRPLASARAGGPAQTLAAFLQSRGRDAASVGALRTAETRTGARGMTHLRVEQSVDGLAVYGAYAKAAFDASGNLVHLIDRLSRVPAAALAPARIDAQEALRVALARLHPDAQASLRPMSTAGNTTVFEGGVFFHEAPTVTAVAAPLADGTMARAWLVSTWSNARNLLNHTLVSGDGEVLKVELRTASDSYNVFPVDPGKGPQTIVNGPGAGNAQSPAGWLAGRSEKNTSISGNNVAAYLDTDHNNRADAGGTKVTGGNFLAAANLAAQPATAVNQAVAVQNLFYLNNRVHDILYSYGFNESAGNFQVDNFGKGGAGADPVSAEAQDGGGLDNANFATPADGSKPRMQMFLWTGPLPTHEVVVSAPGINATYGAKGAQFGPALTTTGLSQAIVASSPADACATVSAAVSGKIALVDRGTCDFVTKAQKVQAAGALGMIVANNQGGTDTFVMGGTNRRVTIPSVMISQNDGAALRSLASPKNGTMRLKAVQPLLIDGSLDSGVVYHEYGHGLSWRMIGGMSGPLAGAIGEGASDGVAMLINGNDKMGVYAGSSPNGIRRFPYAGYPLNYGNVTGAEVHDDGEIYAAVIWRLIELFPADTGRANLFTYYVNGMNFTPSTPAYEDMRDGILAAVAVGSNPGDRCTIWSAFAQFGIGVGASGVVNPDGITVTITPSFAKPGDCP
ncbi:MAG: M36 family metallopeptidase [Burkholderiales bacterium]|nr:M36 family metallopeptidase [Burkholderiales bacterium]